jgi:hypothetical protein
MGILYDLVSDFAREGYELGKGPWGDDFVEALRSSTPIDSVTTFLTREGAEGGMGWGPISPERAAAIAREVVDFAAAHADWRVINDTSSEIVVADEEEWRRLVDEGYDPTDKVTPIYRQVGSRFSR